MAPTSASNQLLKSSLLEHEGLLLSFANRVAVGGDLERLVDLLESSCSSKDADGGSSSKGGTRTKTDRGEDKLSALLLEAGTHRKAMMELAVLLDHYRMCKDELDSLDGKDAPQVDALILRIQEGPVANGDSHDGTSFEARLAEALGISQDDPNHDDEDDVELAIAVGGGPFSSLRCPITTKLLEDPVKNTVCGHTYSRQAILQHLRVGNRRQCPVAGCTAANILPVHLKEDIALTQLVRRQKRRDDAAQKRRQMARATASMAEDEEEEDFDNDDDDDDDIGSGSTHYGSSKKHRHHNGPQPVIKNDPK